MTDDPYLDELQSFFFKFDEFDDFIRLDPDAARFGIGELLRRVETQLGTKPCPDRYEDPDGFTDYNTWRTKARGFRNVLLQHLDIVKRVQAEVKAERIAASNKRADHLTIYREATATLIDLFDDLADGTTTVEAALNAVDTDSNVEEARSMLDAHYEHQPA